MSGAAFRREWGLALLLAAAAMITRLAFWKATPDAGWAYSAFYKGDAPVWIDYARGLQAGAVVDNGLPLRPPGMGYLLSWVWDGTGAGLSGVKLLWCGLGALLPPLFYLALPRELGPGVRLFIGVCLVLSTGLMILSTSLNNETPYLVLVALTFLGTNRLVRGVDPATLAGVAVLSGLACLVRVEHVLFAGLLVLFLAGRAFRNGSVAGRRAAFLAVLGALAFLAPLVPWHLGSWSRIEDLNRSRPLPSQDTAMLAEIEALHPTLVWEPEAARWREELPGFGRRHWSAFLVAWAAIQGKASLGADDVAVFPRVFGSTPGPLPSHPFVSSYGGLNFYVANNDSATGGFSRAILETEREPDPALGPLPPALRERFRPAEGELSLLYPPHLLVFREGMRMGWDWIASHPGRFLRLVGNKLRITGAGAALGLTGHNLPVGLDAGLRRPVDLVVPLAGWPRTVWHLVLLGLVLAGAWATRGSPQVRIWMLFLASKLAVVVLFFGYARIGATVAPVVALLAVTGGAGLLNMLRVPALAVLRRRGVPVALGLLVLGTGIEVARGVRSPQLVIRGRPVLDQDPYPEKLYIEQYIYVRYGGETR